MRLANALGHFLHGLTFFTLGLTVVFLRYRSHRIILARRLTWLGIFGLCEALAAWDLMFVRYVEVGIGLPVFIRPAILACGYAFLFAFGYQTFRPDADLPISPLYLLIGLNGVWLIFYFIIFNLVSPDVARAARIFEMVARCALALPGGLLVSIGLRRQSYETLERHLRASVRRYLQLIEVMAGAFGVLNLLVAPSVLWLSPSVIETETLTLLTAIVWVAVGSGITVGFVRALTTVQSEVETWIEGVERIQALTVERERIGRDLHDGTIQSIYAAGLLLEGIRHLIPHDPAQAQAQLGRVMDDLNKTIQDIRQYIFDLRSDMPDDDVESGIRRLLRDFHINTLLETDLQVSGSVVHIPSVERRRHVLQIVREALANTARHARARWVTVQLEYGPEALTLVISDNGVGMKNLSMNKGFGLRNMRERARLLDAQVDIDTAPGEGVTLRLTVPY